MQGWLKLHRAIRENEVWENPNRLKVFLWCLTEALYEPATRYGIALQPGQFITTTREGAKDCDMKFSTFIYHFYQLQDSNAIRTEIRTEIGTYRTLVTVMNWDSYQNDAPDVGTEIGTLHFRKLERHWNKGNYILKKRRNKEHALSIASSVKSGENTRLDAVYPVLFEQWYAVYPNKKAKAAAYESWSRLRPTLELAERMIAAVHAQIAWRNNAGDEFIPPWKYPEKWIEKCCWEDETGPPEVTEESLADAKQRQRESNAQRLRDMGLRAQADYILSRGTMEGFEESEEYKKMLDEEAEEMMNERKSKIENRKSETFSPPLCDPAPPDFGADEHLKEGGGGVSLLNRKSEI